MRALRILAVAGTCVVVIAPMCVALAIWQAVQEFEKWDT